MDNMAFVNRLGARISFRCDPEKPVPHRIFAELAEYQAEEPSAWWHLETRGDLSGWHRFDATPTK